MKEKKEKRRKAVKSNSAAANEQTSEAENESELNLPLWSVVSFESSIAGGLTYTEAERKMSELAEQKVSGLCIITDESAGRIGDQT